MFVIIRAKKDLAIKNAEQESGIFKIHAKSAKQNFANIALLLQKEILVKLALKDLLFQKIKLLVL